MEDSALLSGGASLKISFWLASAGATVIGSLVPGNYNNLGNNNRFNASFGNGRDGDRFGNDSGILSGHMPVLPFQ